VHKTVSVLLIFIGVLLGLLFVVHLFVVHLFSFITNTVGWISSSDWLSLGKRVLTAFIVGALAYKSFTVGRRRLREGAPATE
jgi:hypothetical protein